VRTGGILGTISEGWVGLVGLRYHHLLIPSQRSAPPTHDGVTLTYTADLVPFASVRIPKGTPPATHATGIRSIAEHGLSTRGIGLYPLGLRVGASRSGVLRPFIAGHTGIFYLFDELPDERGRHTNFAVGVGVGMELSLTQRATLTLGYRYHHLSNGFRGRINPGLDANLLYIGVGTTP
jgi:opacity protein-like surface antigen